MSAERELAIYELFFDREGLLPLWLRLRSHVEQLGAEVRVEPRERYAELDRRGPA